MNAYHLSVLIGLSAHLVIKYVVAPGWKLSDFIGGEWRYILTSAALTAILAVFGPEIINVLASFLPGDANAVAALGDAPNLVGFLIGSTGGSLAYNLPLVGNVLRDALAPRAPKDNAGA